MKWLGLLAPFAISYFQSSSSRARVGIKESALEVFETITYKSREPVFLMIGAYAGAALLCGSFFMFLLEATRLYDAQGFVFWNSTLISSAIIFSVATGSLLYVYFSAWPGVKKAKRKAKSKIEVTRNDLKKRLEDSGIRGDRRSPLEEALSLLVLDYISDRRVRRENRQEERAYNAALRGDRRNESRDETTRRSSSFSEKYENSDEPTRSPDQFH